MAGSISPVAKHVFLALYIVTYVCDPGYEFITMDSTRTCQSDQTWSNENIECGLGTCMYVGKQKNAFLSILVYIVLLRCLVQYNSSKTLYFHSAQTCYTTEFHTFCEIMGKKLVTQ